MDTERLQNEENNQDSAGDTDNSTAADALVDDLETYRSLDSIQLQLSRASYLERLQVQTEQA
jgi:hypothetical protein